MIVAAAVGPTIRPGPAQVTLTLVIRRLAAISVDAPLVTGLGTVLLAVSVKTTLALAAEAAVSISAKRVGMTVVQAEIALIHIRALCVRPAGLVGLQTAVSIVDDDRAAVDMGLIEIALHAHTGDGIFQAVTPATTERMQAASAIGMPAAAFALFVAGKR